MGRRPPKPQLPWLVRLVNGDLALIYAAKARTAQFKAKLDHGRLSVARISAATPEDIERFRHTRGIIRAAWLAPKKKPAAR